jgi:hypothetical protein
LAQRGLNGAYAGWFNRAHGRCGHLYQGRFKAFLIDKEAYFAEVLRYVVLNPVRAKMVERPEVYKWSSYRATAGLETAPEWLDLATVLPLFGGEREPAHAAYREFVLAKIGCEDRLWDQLTNQLYLGAEGWIKTMRGRVESKPRSTDHPRTQRAPLRIHGTAEDALDPRRGRESGQRNRGGDPSYARQHAARSGRMDRMARGLRHATLDRGLAPAPKRRAHLESHQTMRARVWRGSNVTRQPRRRTGNAASLIPQMSAPWTTRGRSASAGAMVMRDQHLRTPFLR